MNTRTLGKLSIHKQSTKETVSLVNITSLRGFFALSKRC